MRLVLIIFLNVILFALVGCGDDDDDNNGVVASPIVDNPGSNPGDTGDSGDDDNGTTPPDTQPTIPTIPDDIVEPADPVAKQFFDQLNGLRVNGVECGEQQYTAGYLSWNEDLKTYADQLSNLLANNVDTIRLSDIEKVAKQVQLDNPGIEEVHVIRGTANAQDANEVNVNELVNGWVNIESVCRQIASQSMGQFTVSTDFNGGSSYTILMLSSSNNPLPEGVETLFKSINQVREAGLTCGGQSYPAVEPLLWRQALAQAAEQMVNTQLAGQPPLSVQDAIDASGYKASDVLRMQGTVVRADAQSSQDTTSSELSIDLTNLDVLAQLVTDTSNAENCRDVMSASHTNIGLNYQQDANSNVLWQVILATPTE